MESRWTVRIALALLLTGVLAVSLAGLAGVVAAPPQESAPPIPIPEALRAVREVPTTVMQRVYDAVKTPYKYGVILRPREGESVDCPNVFRHGDRWYMLYVGIRNEVGYETRLAVSDDLLSWTPLGTVLPFRDSGWDRWQADGSLALVDPEWGGSSALQPHEGRYWISYFGGAKQGYEPDPLSLGLAWTRTPTEATPWTRLEENPVLRPDQPEGRPFERATLYKSHVLWDKAESLGYPFVMYYNAKQQGPWIERIGMAVSRDMVRWRRYGHEPVIDNGKGISGDPQIVRMGDVWVMFYFGAGWKPGAFDTFAVSYDLVHWTKWTGPDLVAPSLPWDKTYAHKPWVLKHDGVVYHFYCAVGTEGRVIAVATSRDLRAAPPAPGAPPSPDCTRPGREIWLDAPASRFTESSPIGNGRLGAMVFGGIAEERIVLNESGMWSGSAQDADRPAAAAELPDIRRLLLEGKNVEAEALVNAHFTCAGKGSGLGAGANVPYGCYQTLGNLRLRFVSEGTGGGASEYRRALDLREAVVKTSYRLGKARHTREAFVSAPDEVLVLRLGADLPGQLSFQVSLDRPERAKVEATGADGLEMGGQLNDGREGGGGVRFAVRLRVLPTGGQVRVRDSAVEVRGADDAVLLLAAATDIRTFAAPRDASKAPPPTSRGRPRSPTARCGAITWPTTGATSTAFFYSSEPWPGSRRWRGRPPRPASRRSGRAARIRGWPLSTSTSAATCSSRPRDPAGCRPTCRASGPRRSRPRGTATGTSTSTPR
jgi:predicted GH43/DUF377 family glycosyl hydrolase